MRPIFSGARRAIAAAALVTTIASLPGTVLASHDGSAAPVVSSPTISLLPYDASVTFSVSELATDADGDVLTIITGTPKYGAVTRTGDQIEYRAGSTFTGTDSFSYFVDDGHGHSGFGTVTVKDTTGPELYNLPYGLVVFAGLDGTYLLPDLTDMLWADDNVGVASVTQSPAPGTVLPPGYHSIAFTATDVAGNPTTETVEIEVALPLTVTKATGDAVEGEPEGTKVLRFGVPSINQYGDTAYLGRLTAPGVRSTLAILAGNPATVRTRVGDDAVGIPGAKFNFFLDPVLDDDCNIAFIARVSGQGITPENDRGVWVHNGQELQLIAREGGEVPGIPGAQFGRFTSISIKDGEVLFLAELIQGVGGIDKSNDAGVWAWDAYLGLRPFVREGGMVNTMNGPKQVTLFSMLRSAGGSRGHGRSHAASSSYTLWARCADGSKAILTTTPPFYGGGEPGSEFELSALAETRQPLLSYLGSDLFVPKIIGLPATNSQYGLAATMTLANNPAAGVDASNNQAVFVGAPFFGWIPVARKGDVATEGTKWLGFKDPIINANYDLAWVGRLTGPGVGVSNDYAIGYARSAGEGCVEVLAREGDAVPGVEGAKWAQFLSIALPDGIELGKGGGPLGDLAPANGPVFLARIEPSSPEGASITSANDVGVWAIDGEHQFRLLLREGDTVKVNGVDKQVKAMTLLNAVIGSPDVSRSFNERGQIILRVRFTDNSQAVLTLRIPVQAADNRG